MKKRYLFALISGVIGFIFSAVFCYLAFGMLLGVLWLFIFGDNQWPSYIDTALPIALVLVFLVVWLIFIVGGFLVGKRMERK